MNLKLLYFILRLSMRSRDVRILDQFARQKRADKFIENLDRDNFHSDKEDVLVQMFEDLEKERALRAAERKGRNSSLHEIDTQLPHNTNCNNSF